MGRKPGKPVRDVKLACRLRGNGATVREIARRLGSTEYFVTLATQWTGYPQNQGWKTRKMLARSKKQATKE